MSAEIEKRLSTEFELQHNRGTIALPLDVGGRREREIMNS